MANIKVSEMTEATTFDDDDYTMIVQANQNKKITKENMLNEVETNISNIETSIGNLTNLETEDKTSIVNAINENNTKNLNITGQILWSNANQDEPFQNNTTITLSNDNYDELEIFFKDAYDQQRIYSQKILKGYSTLLQTNHSGGSDLIYHRYRLFTYNNDTSYTFGSGKQLPTNSSNVDTNASYITPICIIGYKTGLFNNEGE